MTNRGSPLGQERFLLAIYPLIGPVCGIRWRFRRTWLRSPLGKEFRKAPLMRYASILSFAVVSMLGTFAASIEAGGGEKKDDKGKVRRHSDRPEGSHPHDPRRRRRRSREVRFAGNSRRQVGRDAQGTVQCPARPDHLQHERRSARNHLARPRARQGERRRHGEGHRGA